MVSPSKAFKDDVLQVVNPLIEDLKLNMNQSDPFKAPVHARVEESKRQGQGSEANNDVLTSRLLDAEKEIKNLNKALAQKNADVNSRVDDLEAKFAALKNAVPPPCQ